jgi:hypothetical protein
MEGKYDTHEVNTYHAREFETKTAVQPILKEVIQNEEPKPP